MTMPLFKGEGYKCTPNKAIDYIMRKDKAMLISSLYLDDGVAFAKQFAETAHSFGKCKSFNERKYYHFKLSCDPKDNVTPEQSQRLAEQLALKLFPDHEAVIATHIDTGVIHSHIIVNSVDFATGKKLHIDNRDYAGMKDMANTLGVEYELSSLDWRKTAKERVSAKEQHIQKEHRICWKDDLRRLIDTSISECDSFISLRNSLEKQGVKISKLTDKTISFLYKGQEKPIRGDRLGADYSRQRLEERVLLGHEKTQKPSKERKSIAERLEEKKAIIAGRDSSDLKAPINEIAPRPRCRQFSGKGLSIAERLSSATAAVRQAAEYTEAIDVEYTPVGDNTVRSGVEYTPVEDNTVRSDGQKRHCRNYEKACTNAIHLTFTEKIAALLMGKRHVYVKYDYRRSAQMAYNIKEMSGTLGFLAEHGIDNYAQLERRVGIISGRLSAAELELKQLDSEMIRYRQLFGASLNYQKNKAITEQYLHKVLFRDNFFRQHQNEIEAFAKAREQLKAAGADPEAPPELFRKKLDSLKNRRSILITELRASKEELYHWQRAKESISKILEERLPKYRLDTRPKKQKSPHRDDMER